MSLVTEKIYLLILSYEHYFRELVFLWKKIILFTIVIFIDNIETRIITIIFILYVSIQIQNDSKPFLTERLNYTEKNACVSTFFIFLIKAFNFSLNGNIISEYICMILVMAIEIKFLYISLFKSFSIKIFSFVLNIQSKRMTSSHKINSLMNKLSHR